MGFIADIFNLEVGLAVRSKLNFLMKFYNALAVSDGSFNLLRINASFVKSSTPTGKFLQDDGSWQPITASQTLQQTLDNGNISTKEVVIVKDIDNAAYFVVGIDGLTKLIIGNSDLNSGVIRILNSSETGTVTLDGEAGLISTIELLLTSETPNKIAEFDANKKVKSGSKSIAELIADIANSETNANAYADGLIASLVGTSPVTLDTLEEITTALQNNPNVISEILTALGNRVKFDVNNQGLSVTEKLNARTNIGLDGFDATAITSALASKYDASNPNNYETPSQLNTRDTNNRNRANHSGTQLASTISDFQATVSSNTDVAANTAARHTHSNSIILNAITEAFTTLLKTGYDNAVSWISTNGTNLINHLTNTSNPHNTTSSQVGLGNVDNTSDINKPVSNAQATAIGLKEDSSNKSNSLLDIASTTKFPVWSAVVSYTSTLSGSGLNHKQVLKRINLS